MKYIATNLNEFLLIENIEDYKGQHTAPGKGDGNEPMHNLNDTFPDMYSNNALRYYGVYRLDDASVIHQIQSAHNKPNKPIKIYRAVPNFNKEIDKEINGLTSIINYYNKFNFFPMKNKIVDELREKILNDQPSLGYDDIQKLVLDNIHIKIDELNNKKAKPIKINSGDQVTTSRLYAKQHGEYNLNNNYKILTKTVKASQLYTDGNSIFEQGYISD